MSPEDDFCRRSQAPLERRGRRSPQKQGSEPLKAQTKREGNAQPGERRAWQRMLSGRRLDLLDPSPLDIEVEDIAHGLARVARWNGQTRGENAFSVAQHSVLVEALLTEMCPAASPCEQLSALLHDAPEYVIGDMISPFKNAIGVDYRLFEERLSRAIRIRFGLTPEMPETTRRRIKQADRASAFYEAIALAGFEEREAVQLFGRPGVSNTPDLTPLSPGRAQAAFIERFAALLADFEAGPDRGV